MSKTLASYWKLTKPDINLLIAITVMVGFCMAQPASWHKFPVIQLSETLLGALLVSSGAAILNQFLERSHDARMRRTNRRPLVTGCATPNHAVWFGSILCVAGCIYHGALVNWLSSSLALLTAILYLTVYTPLKRKTALCTFVGAFPGAAAPLIGWAAASGGLDLGAWILYTMLYLRQFPHFMAIAWIYRADYDRAGYRVLPSGLKKASWMAWQSIVPSVFLVFAGMLPTLLGYVGAFYLLVSLPLGIGFLYCARRMATQRSNHAAHRLLIYSILYLLIVFLLMLFDRR